MSWKDGNHYTDVIHAADPAVEGHAVYPRSPHLIVSAFSVMSTKLSLVLQELRHKATAERLGGGGGGSPDRAHYDMFKM